MVMNRSEESAKYLSSCRSQFWRRVFAAELTYLLKYLTPEDDILSVGCGPAIIEQGLMEKGFSVTGLDVSREAIACAPDTMRAVVAPAEKMPFPEAAFDAVLFIVSLQFIADYRQALAEARRVLRPNGRVFALLLNPGSEFYKKKQLEVDSYVRKIKHTHMDEIESSMAAMFQTKGEYFLGIVGEQVFPDDETETAALYVLQGIKTHPG
jgi:ubiquinone/menaquinone biosynthesis C-methylase UbiE